METDIANFIVIASIVLCENLNTFVNPFFRMCLSSKATLPENHPAGISIIIYTHNNAREIQSHAELFLQQQYSGNFELIFVDDNSYDDTVDIISLLKNKYRNLHLTHIPPTSKYISKKKLAMTLGAKCAQNEWLIFIDPTAYPSDESWLESVSKNCDKANKLLLGYCRYEKSTNLNYIYDRLKNTCYEHKAIIADAAFNTSNNFIVIKKELLLTKDCFADSLKFRRGEYDYIINNYSGMGYSAVLHPSGTSLLEKAPTFKNFLDEKLNSAHTGKHLKKKWGWKITHCIDNVMLTVQYVALFFSFAYSYCQNCPTFAVAGISGFVLSALIKHKTIERVKQIYPARIPWYSLPYLEVANILLDIYLALKYSITDKKIFERN